MCNNENAYIMFPELTDVLHKPDTSRAIETGGRVAPGPRAAQPPNSPPGGGGLFRLRRTNWHTHAGHSMLSAALAKLTKSDQFRLATNTNRHRSSMLKPRRLLLLLLRYILNTLMTAPPFHPYPGRNMDDVRDFVQMNAIYDRHWVIFGWFVIELLVYTIRVDVWLQVYTERISNNGFIELKTRPSRMYDPFSTN